MARKDNDHAKTQIKTSFGRKVFLVCNAVYMPSSDD